jgi:lysophospholipase L1-like esterase
VQLAERLRERGMRVATPTIIAQTGWTTDELAMGIKTERPVGPFDIVSLLIGVNNQYRGRAVEEYRLEFAALLASAIGLAADRAMRVVVLSIPDWGVAPFAAGRDAAWIAARIDAFNEANRDEALSAGAQYVDVTPVSRRARDDASLIADDGLHPSAVMYAEWTQLVLPRVLAVL